MSNGVRKASTPAAGAGRVGIDVALANIATYLLSQVVPPEILGDTETVVVILISGALAAAGKWLRNQGSLVGEFI